MLTSEGANLTLRALAEKLTNGTIVVSSGSEQASAPIDEIAAQDSALTATATFGEDAANFEWTERSVLTADGTVVDTKPEDLGRKAQGHEWVLDAVIELAAA